MNGFLALGTWYLGGGIVSHGLGVVDAAETSAVASADGAATVAGTGQRARGLAVRVSAPAATITTSRAKKKRAP